MGKDFKVIRGGRLLDLASRSAADRDLLIEGGEILEIGPPGLDAPEGAAEIDASGTLLMPGLINAHTHGHGSIGKGLGDRWTLEHLLHAGPWLNANRGLEDKQLSTMLNAAEMVLKGCTATYDLYFEVPMPTVEGMHAVAKGYEAVGVRAVLAPMMADRTLYEAISGLLEAFPEAERQRLSEMRASPTEEILKACRALLTDRPFESARTRLALAPTIPLHCSDDFIAGCRDLAEEFDVGLHMHLAESRVQAVTGIERYGKTLTAHLEDVGLLSPRFTGAHCVWLDDDDVHRLADNGCAIAHNPGSNLRLGNGIAPARRLLAKGATVGIGTDGSHCSDHQNMFEAMRLASFVSRIVSPETDDWLETTEVIAMATEGSAMALGFGDDVGRLAPGARADIVFLDLSNINFVPLNDPANQIVHAEDGSAVRSVMIDGDFILKDRQFTTINYAQLCRDAQAASERLLAANAEARAFSGRMEAYVSKFCVGLAQHPYHIHRWGGDAPAACPGPEKEARP
ncbi:MAG: amidohydrolase family protein [Hyphomicrobiales bacterium]|nr:amidohydrolase family protein [Hyphomicrobiales bacterium]